MRLTSSQKKIVGITIFILLSAIEFLFLIALVASMADDESTVENTSISFLFVMGLFLFPLTWAFRLWRSGVRESIRQGMDDKSGSLLDADTVIKLQVKVELPEYRKLNFQLAYTKPVFLYIHFIAFAMVVLSWPHLRENWFSLFALIFTLYLPIAVYRSSNSNYKATKMLHELVSYEFTKDTISGVSESTTSTMRWELLHKFQETKHWMLLYTNKQVAMLIPKKAFASAADMDTFRQMARAIPA